MKGISMTQKQKIAKLEADVAELRMKIALLEARPMIITVTPQPAPAPFRTAEPWVPTYPYIGDPVLPGTTCGGTQSSPMSSQQSHFMQ